MHEFRDRVRNEIRLALNEMSKQDRDKISLSEMCIIVNRFDYIDKPTHVCGWKVLAGNVPSQYNYYLAFDDLDDIQSKFLKYHETIVEEGLHDAGIIAE